MAVTDPISDFLTRIRNAQVLNKKEVLIPGSKMLMNLAKLLQTEGFVQKAVWKRDNKQGQIVVRLKYLPGGKTMITKLQRISRPGLRIYRGYKEIKRVLSGMGISVVSTPKGLLTDRDCRRQKIGGEVLCEVW